MELLALELSEIKFYEDKIKELENMINELNEKLASSQSKYMTLALSYSRLVGLMDDHITNLNQVRNNMRLDKVVGNENPPSSL